MTPQDTQSTLVSLKITFVDQLFNLFQVRVCEGKEPEHFFVIFKRRLLIYQVSATVSHGIQ